METNRSTDGEMIEQTKKHVYFTWKHNKSSSLVNRDKRREVHTYHAHTHTERVPGERTWQIYLLTKNYQVILMELYLVDTRAEAYVERLMKRIDPWIGSCLSRNPALFFLIDVRVLGIAFSSFLKGFW